MSLEIEVSAPEPVPELDGEPLSVIEGLPDDYMVRDLFRDSENTLYLVTVHEPEKTKEQFEVEAELSDVEKKYHKLFKEEYNKDNPKSLVGSICSLFTIRRRGELEELGKIVEGLTDKQDEFRKKNSLRGYNLFIGQQGKVLDEAEVTSLSQTKHFGTIIVFSYEGKEGILHFPGYRVEPTVDYDGRELELEKLKSMRAPVDEE